MITDPTFRKPFATFKRRTAPTIEAMQTVDQTDLRQEYVERLLAADGCVGEFGVQALMGLFPREF